MRIYLLLFAAILLVAKIRKLVKNRYIEKIVEENVENVEKAKNPDKPLNYFEFIEELKRRERNISTGRFPAFNVGQFQVSLQAGDNSNNEKETLAGYRDLEFMVADENGFVNIFIDKRFKNMPYKDYYFSFNEERERVKISSSHLFEILSYIEQMDVEPDSYRNKKYFISVDTGLEKVVFKETSDKEINELIGNTKLNSIDLRIERYVGLYEDGSNNFIIVMREYARKEKYKYYALYPKDIEDIYRLMWHYDFLTLTSYKDLLRNYPEKSQKDWFTDNIYRGIIECLVDMTQSTGNIYKKDFNTWINNMQGKLFDCSANQPILYNWVEMKKGFPLALDISNEGRVKEIYGDNKSLISYFSSMEQNIRNILAVWGERKYFVQHYNWNPNPSCINRYIGKCQVIIYGNAIVMCEVDNQPSSINADDIKFLFDNGYLDEKMKKQLLEHTYNNFFNEDYRRRKQEYLQKSEKEKTIDRAKTKNLPDGIFIIMRFNEKARLRREEVIDIHEAFPEESKELINIWITKTSHLLNSNLYQIGDTFFNRSTAEKKGDKEKYEMEDKKYKELYEALISENPGFSQETYSDAVSLGIYYAR